MFRCKGPLVYDQRFFVFWPFRFTYSKSVEVDGRILGELTVYVVYMQNIGLILNLILSIYQYCIRFQLKYKPDMCVFTKMR